MSRSHQGKKGSGHEYWSRRPHNPGVPGKITKKRTTKTERQLDKKIEQERD